MQVKSVAGWEHSAILSTFIKLPVVIKTVVLSIFEWPFYTGLLLCCAQHLGLNVVLYGAVMEDEHDRRILMQDIQLA